MSIHTIVNHWTDAEIWSGEAGNMRDALRKARAADADLRGADLRGADLRGAVLTGAVLTGAVLTGAGTTATRSDGYEFRLFHLKDGTLRIMAGCRWFTPTEARAHWTRTRGGTQLGEESIALVDHLERMARIAGWIDANGDPT